MTTIDHRVLDVAVSAFDGISRVTAPSDAVAEALESRGVHAACCPLDSVAPDSADAIALLADELSATPSDELLIADAAKGLRPGGILAVTALSAIAAAASGADLGGAHGFRAEEVQRALGHNGFDLELLMSPGAASVIAGDPAGHADPALDREPGVLDAGPRIFAVGRLGASAMERSNAYFTTLPRKIVAAAVVCRDDRGRMLLVHDSFKGHWTIPGGVVDRNEDPRTGALREAWEEAGVRVHVGEVLGLFAGSWPDRLVLVYDARPATGEGEPRGPVNAHEIDAVEWVDVDEAMERLAPYVAYQVRMSLSEPGGTHLQVP